MKMFLVSSRIVELRGINERSMVPWGEGGGVFPQETVPNGFQS